MNICAALGEPALKDKETCAKFHENRVSKRVEDAARLKVPLIMSEFGACMNSVECYTEITSATN